MCKHSAVYCVPLSVGIQIMSKSCMLCSSNSRCPIISKTELSMCDLLLQIGLLQCAVPGAHSRGAVCLRDVWPPGHAIAAGGHQI